MQRMAVMASKFVRERMHINRALGILWCGYGILFTLIGVPLLMGQNSGFIILSVLGVMFMSIAAMAVYIVCIEAKYHKK